MSKYEALGQELGKLVDEKNAAYGSSFDRSGEIMRVLYPNGIAPEQMTDALGVVRVIDKLFRIATQKDAFGESPWKDVCGYALLGAARSAAAPANLEAKASAASDAFNAFMRVAVRLGVHDWPNLSCDAVADRCISLVEADQRVIAERGLRVKALKEAVQDIRDAVRRPNLHRDAIIELADAVLR